jgi:hypothetical protein
MHELKHNHPMWKLVWHLLLVSNFNKWWIIHVSRFQSPTTISFKRLLCKVLCKSLHLSFKSMYDHLPLVLETEGAFFISLNLLQSNNLSKFCKFYQSFKFCMICTTTKRKDQLLHYLWASRDQIYTCKNEFLISGETRFDLWNWLIQPLQYYKQFCLVV